MLSASTLPLGSPSSKAEERSVCSRVNDPLHSLVFNASKPTTGMKRLLMLLSCTAYYLFCVLLLAKQPAHSPGQLESGRGPMRRSAWLVHSEEWAVSQCAIRSRRGSSCDSMLELVKENEDNSTSSSVLWQRGRHHQTHELAHCFICSFAMAR